MPEVIIVKGMRDSVDRVSVSSPGSNSGDSLNKCNMISNIPPIRVGVGDTV